MYVCMLYNNEYTYYGEYYKTVIVRFHIHNKQNNSVAKIQHDYMCAQSFDLILC